MRIYRSFHRNSDYESIRAENFPPTFAVCRNIYPSPQFQLLEIEQVRGRDEYATYRVHERPIPNEECYLIHDGNPEDRMYGEMNLMRRNSDNSVRVRFEIPNVLLVTNLEEFQIVLFDDMSVLPPLREVMIPRNGRENQQFQSTDAYYIMNYILDRNNFMIPNEIDFHIPGNNFPRDPSFRRQRRQTRRWLDDDQIAPPMVRRTNPVDLMMEDLPRAFRRAAGGAGAVEVQREPAQRQPVQRQPVQAPAPIPAQQPTLQAFTIRALIKAAIAESMTCPIAMTPIEESSAAITTCQHIFDRDSITRWLGDHENCPVCRQATQICN